MSARRTPLSDDALLRLEVLAATVDDMLPVRLRELPADDTTLLRDRHGMTLADLTTRPSGPGRYGAFDRYLRDVMNVTPALLAELQRLRRLARAAEAYLNSHDREAWFEMNEALVALDEVGSETDG